MRYILQTLYMIIIIMCNVYNIALDTLNNMAVLKTNSDIFFSDKPLNHFDFLDVTLMSYCAFRKLLFFRSVIYYAIYILQLKFFVLRPK